MLFLLILTDGLLTSELMYNDNPVDPTSYYQIAGIHGRPYTSWNDPTTVKNNKYCEHSSVLFPTWHRAYLLLFEVRCIARQSKTLKLIRRLLAANTSAACGQDC